MTLSAAQLALSIKRLRAGNPQLDLLQSEPVAIVGMGCRFPGGADSPETFWRLLTEGRNAVGPAPAARWGLSVGDLPVQFGGFLPEVDGFDAAFFGIAPREAICMDPQQRLLLEVAWEALWNASIAPERLAGTQTGVYMAIYSRDYALREGVHPEAISAYTVSGASHGVAAGRIAYLLDLRGGAIAVDTACSSSLAAIHLACQSLRQRECDVALAGGVNLRLAPDEIVSLAKWGMLSPEGRSKVFDAGADGFVPGEGCGVIVLKRLEQALLEGDRILAVIRGSAMNQDGRSTALTAPNGLAQEAVIRQALRNSQAEPAQIGYVEAHGTGTVLGDPIELTALVEALGGEGLPRCAVGSVKTNFGHLEAAAGVAGLIKTVLALGHEQIPRHLHWSTLNPHVTLAGTRFEIPAEPLAWPKGAQPRLAGVSAFGLGGTNVHVVLEEAPRALSTAAPQPSANIQALTVSGRGSEALRAYAARFREYLESAPDSLEAICRAAALGRSHYEHRLCILGSSPREIADTLGRFLDGEESPMIFQGVVRPEEPRALAFLFDGADAGWAGMGRELTVDQPVFRESMHSSRAQTEAGDVRRALAAMMRAWGVQPEFEIEAGTALETLDQLLGRECGIFLELGARSPFGRSVVERAAALSLDITLLPLLQRGQSERLSLMRALAALYSRGVALSWPDFYRSAQTGPAERLQRDLPVYPWQRQRYWIAEAPSSRRRLRTGAPAEHPLLGRVLESPALDRPVFESELSVAALPYLEDHRVSGRPILPLAAFLEMALAANPHKGAALSVEHVVIERSLEVPEAPPRMVQFVDGKEGWQIFSRDGTGDGVPWTRHACGQWGSAIASQPGSLAEARGITTRPRIIEDFYSLLRTLELDFGPAFRTLSELSTGPSAAMGRVRLAGAHGPYRIHPALLDGCLQVVAAALEGGSLLLPASLDSFTLYRSPDTEVWAQAALRDRTAESATADVRVWNANGELVSEIRGLHLRKASFRSRDLRRGWLNRLEWRPKSLTASGSNQPTRRLLLVGGEACELLVGALAARGVSCVLGRPDRRPDLSGFDGVVYLGSLDVPADLSGVAVNGAGVACLAHTLAVSGGGKPPRLWLVTRGAQAVEGNRGMSVWQAPVWGIGRTIALEQPELRCGCIDLDPEGGYEGLLEELIRPDEETQIGFRGGVRYVARMGRIGEEVAETDPVQLTITTPGLLDGLEYRPVSRRAPGPGEVEIRVAFAALNFRDVLNALGRRNDADALGSECAGRIEAVGAGVNEYRVGERVVATVAGALGSYVTVGAMMVARQPEGVSGAEAVTVPIAFLTARYALEQVGRMKAGDRVLIHAAAGGVGQAAVQLAKRAGAEIYATAGSEGKREWLRSQGIEHVYDSRSGEFGAEIRKATGGRGVDLVLNSLAGEMIEAGLGVVAEGGRFVEIGKAGVWERERVRALRGDIEYEVVDWGDVWEREPERVGRMLREIMGEVERGELEGLAYEVYEQREVEQAFRRMAQGRHRGKVVIRQERAGVEIGGQGAYLITGGLGGLGLKVAEWLVGEGAEQVVLVGRHEAGEEARAAVGRMERAGGKVWVRRADVSRREEIEGVVRELEEAGQRLRGVIHAAGVLDDGVLGQQNEERMERVLGPKVAGAWHLHELTKGKEVELFVMFSSLASVLGSAGQANHAAGNAFLDGMAHLRRGQGEAGVSIQWGAWSEVGSARGAELRQRRESKGIGEMSPGQGLGLMGEILRRNLVEAAAGPVDWEVFAREAAGGRAPWLSEMATGTEQGQKAGGSRREQGEFLRRLAEAPAGQRQDLLQGQIRAEAARILGLDPQRIDVRRPLSELGLDSLMAVELRNALAAVLGQRLEATILFKYPTVEALTRHLIPEFHEAERLQISSDAADLQSISEQKAEELLASELDSGG